MVAASLPQRVRWRRPAAWLLFTLAGLALLLLVPAGTAPTLKGSPSTCSAGYPPPPPNDNYVNAIAVASPSTTAGENTCATLESGETVPCCNADRSVWYSWVPAASGIGYADTCGSSFDTVLAVRQGGAGGSTVTYSNDATWGTCRGSEQSAVAFACTSGQRYDFQVLKYDTTTGAAGDGGPFNLKVWGCDGSAPGCPGPANNCFDNALAVGAGMPAASQSTSGADMETAEPDPCGLGASVWFTWVPTASGTAVIDTSGSTFDTVLAAHTGSSVVTLTTLTCNDNDGSSPQSRIAFPCVAGTLYRIQVGGKAAAQGLARLNIEGCLANRDDALPKYVAVGSDGNNPPSCTIGYSFDAATWSRATFPSAPVDCKGVAYNGTHWLAVARTRVWTSVDGIYWTAGDLPLGFIPFGGVAWGDGKWVIAGNQGSAAWTAYYSLDGKTWTMVTLPGPNTTVLGVSWSGTSWLTTGLGGIARSADGITWTWVGAAGFTPSPTLIMARAPFHHNGAWYAAGQSGEVRRSFDGGSTWGPASTPGMISRFATNGQGQVVAAGNVVRVTEDFTSWTAPATPFGSSLWGLTYGDCRYVIGGTGGALGHSTNGLTWTAAPWAWTGSIAAIATSAEPGCGPKASADAAVFNEDSLPKEINVRANDKAGANKLAFSVVSVSGATKGTATATGTGVQYQPDPHATGTDTLTYTIADTKGKTSTATVAITINPVDDPPSFVRSTARIANAGADRDLEVQWATAIAPGPSAAVDEAAQSVVFDLLQDPNPGLFRSTPRLDPQGVLHLEPTGQPGSATLCFQPRDDGDIAPVVDSWLNPVTGVNVGAVQCVEFAQNAQPVAYFQPNVASALPGQRVTFDPCPRPAPECSFDPDGVLVAFLWEFGDGTTSSLEAPLHAFKAPGTYEVRLSVVDNDGGRASHARKVTVGMPGAAAPAEESGAAAVPPLAEAGDDRTVFEGETVELAGLQLGGDPYATTFQWIQVAGPTVTLQGAASAAASFVAPPVPGEPVALVFSLRATDGAAQGPVDFVTIHVLTRNRAPVPSAGGELQVTVGSIVTLDATQTLDPDGDAVTLRWTVVSGDVELSDPEAERPLFQAPNAPTTLTFKLTATDGRATAEDHVTVHVLPAAAAPEAPGTETPVKSAARIEAAKAGSPWGPVLVGGAVLVALALVSAALVLRRQKSD